MTTIENLFFQIFERKNWIIQQVKQQTDLYNQHLASKCLIDGIAPPSWLWNPNSYSQSSDLKELKKEELISKLLLPHLQPTASYFSSHYCPYDKPVVTSDNEELSDGLQMDTQAVNHGLNIGDGPTNISECHDNNMERSFNFVQEQDVSVTSPLDQVEVRVSNIYNVSDQSLARIQRSKSRQTDLELRYSEKAVAKSNLSCENNAKVDFGGVAFSVTASPHVDELKRLARYLDVGSGSCAVKEVKERDCQNNDRDISMYRSKITRSRSSSKQLSSENVTLKLGISSGIENKDSGALAQPTVNSLHHPYHVNDLLKGTGETVVGTELASDALAEDWSIGPRNNMDGASPRTGLEGLVRRAASDYCTFVKPKHFNFDEMAECSENRMLDTSSEKMRCTLAETASSLDKETSHNLHGKTLVKESLVEQAVSKKLEDVWRGSFGADAEECVGAVIKKSGSAINENAMPETIKEYYEAVQHNQNSLASHEADIVRSYVSKSFDVEKCQLKHHWIEGCESSPELLVDEVVLDSEERNKKAGTPLSFIYQPIGVSLVSSLTEEATRDCQGCFIEEVGRSDPISSDSDERQHSNEHDYQHLLHLENEANLINTEDLTCTERTLQESNFPLGEDGRLSSSCSVRSPKKTDLNLIGGDQTMPMSEGFIIDMQKGDGEPGTAGDGINFGKIELPRNTIQQASILEHIYNSSSRHTPLHLFSSTFKLQRNQDLYQSVPNGLLEHMESRSSLYLNDSVGRQLWASYSGEDEANCVLQGVSYSDFLPYSGTRIGWNSRSLYTSPVGKLWESNLSNLESSESLFNSNPEFTCFPIEEYPSISEENEIADEVDNNIQEGINSKVMNSYIKRKTLADTTEARSNPPTLVSEAKNFSGRGSVGSVNTEVSITGARNKINEMFGNCCSKKRNCTIQAKENKALSMGINGVKKPKVSLQNRFSNPKLSGKRDIKVKALEAAEAPKRLEERIQNEHKLKKEALKLEQARGQEENLRQLDLNKKKKKGPNMKRLRDEKYRMGKERKRKQIEATRRHQRDQEEKLHAGKVENEKQGGTADEKMNSRKDFNNESKKDRKMEKERRDDFTLKKSETEARTAGILTSDVQQSGIAFNHRVVSSNCGDNGKAISMLDKSTKNYLVTKTSLEKSYEISPYQCSDDEEDDLPTKFIPSWASKNWVPLVLSSQQKINPDVIFPVGSFCSIDEVLQPRKRQQILICNASLIGSALRH
ncbi:unnamed protein product [Ilex paraguariensis]|uniref:Inner centromere protein ARK-binding domain-containing protein n=1 Tax=Ilex paraguariensis TaxID=185542 RepID=A0ABC8S3F3_9AQUA